MNDDPLHEFSFQDFEAAAVLRGAASTATAGRYLLPDVQQP